MNRADLYCVWGNTLTLLPCFLFSDPKQLPPTVMTPNDKDADDNYLNRFAKSGELPALLFLQASGIPTYRLATQLRMGYGLFDMVFRILYKEVPQKYPTVSPCLKGKLLPVFIHTPGSRVYTDDITGSKRSADQITIALDLMVDLVKSKNIDPSKIGIISPYMANLELLDRIIHIRKNTAYKGIPPASTVDSFQG